MQDLPPSSLKMHEKIASMLALVLHSKGVSSSYALG
jgi:hypothetical protein